MYLSTSSVNVIWMCMFNMSSVLVVVNNDIIKKEKSQSVNEKFIGFSHSFEVQGSFDQKTGPIR